MAEGAAALPTRGSAWWAAAPIAGTLALVLFAAAPRGPALSGDSAVYLSVADALAQGRGFMQFNDVPYTRWAPLLPLLLAPWSALGVDPARAGQGVNLLALAGVFALAAGWLVRHVASIGVRAFALAFLFASATLLEAAVFVWSDLTFLALALGALHAWDGLDGGADPARRRRIALIAALWTAAACLLRYAGLALVPVGIALLWLRPPAGDRAGRAGRGREAARFTAVALAPIALWCAHNVAVSGGLFGPHTAAGVGPLAHAFDLLGAFGVWAIGSGRGESMRAWAGAVLVAGSALALLAARPSAAQPGRVPASVVAMLGFIVASLALLVGWSSYSAIERIQERYTIPFVVPGVLVAAWAADRLVARVGRAPARRMLVAAVAGVLAFGIGVAAFRVARHVERYRGPGTWGYNTAPWDRSFAGGLLHVVAGLPAAARIYSDDPGAIYARLRRPARLLPELVPGAGGRAVVPAQWSADRPEFWAVEFVTAPAGEAAASAAIARAAACGTWSRVRYDDGWLVRAEACAARDAPGPQRARR